MIFSALVALVLVSRPAKLRQDTRQTLARLSNTEQDIFCQVHVWLMFDSKNGIPARVRLDSVSVWFKNLVLESTPEFRPRTLRDIARFILVVNNMSCAIFRSEKLELLLHTLV